VFECIDGDIFDYAAQAFASPVNCVGIMGKGLALQLKQRYPMNYTFYEQACKQGRVQLGYTLADHATAARNPGLGGLVDVV
jgi:O-acetyl-ADP-ribose deacetylase (regulator of RNase III)